jgi:Helitron helicase-like domain at N-terminus
MPASRAQVENVFIFCCRYILYRRSPLQIELSLGALTQQFIVDSWIRVQSNDLNYIKSRLPQGLMVTSRNHLSKMLDRVARDRNYDVGRSFVLPTSYRGGEEHMERLYRHCIESLRVGDHI